MFVVKLEVKPPNKRQERSTLKREYGVERRSRKEGQFDIVKDRACQKISQNITRRPQGSTFPLTEVCRDF